MELRDYTFLGITQSLCPECLSLAPTKIVVRDGRVYFRQRCATHGLREDFVCSDASYYDRMEFMTPTKLPEVLGSEPNKGCPFDCGLCTEHGQHTCIGLVELTSSCNLSCPICFASSGPGGKHLSVDQCRAAFDRLVEVEGRAEVLQLSGGRQDLGFAAANHDATRPRPACGGRVLQPGHRRAARREGVLCITITSFLDAYNFDVRRMMKCCTHHVLPSGHVIPFCAYNVPCREGHVALPALCAAGVAVLS